jgi:hypothetical protein
MKSSKKPLYIFQKACTLQYSTATSYNTARIIAVIRQKNFKNKETTARGVWSGQSLYTRFFLSVYDWLALGLHCRFLWNCSSAHMLELYNQKVTANHLDVGVGTGYFLDNCKFPTASPRLALMDLNPDCLERAGKRVARYNPVKYQRNVLESVKIDVEKFDSIGMLHFTASPARRGRKGSSLRWENQYLPREDSR